MTTRPKFIPRTGETELHSMGNLLDRHAHRPFYATQKMDGFSLSYGNHAGSFVASTRERLLSLNESTVFGDAFRRSVVPLFDDDAILQGELCGPNIRCNPHGLSDLCFFAFDLLVAGRRAGFQSLVEFCRARCIETVPILRREFHPTKSDCLEIASATRGEGAVFRPLTEVFDEFQGRVSFKVFNPDYAFHH